MRDQVFVSYAHEDKAWLDAFTTMLAPARQRELVHVWSDEAIRPGANWAAEIQAALSRARVGLLLVTANFLGSQFIVNEELRSLMRDASQDKLRLFWVPISASLFDVMTDLAEVQAAWDPEQPLDQLPVPQQQKAIAQICRNLLKELPKLSRETRDSFRETVVAKLAGRYEILEEVGAGASSIVYRAKPHGLDSVRAVKALVPSATQKDLAPCFRRSVELASKLDAPAYQRIYEYVLDESPCCIISEFVDGVRLDEHIAAGRVPPRQIKIILLELARALAQAHEHDCLHEGLTPSSIQLDAALRPKLSAFRFTPVVAQAETSGLSLFRRDTITYLSPEAFEGGPRTALTDQYALGLIGYELLSGERVPPIQFGIDFLGRPALYEKLGAGGAWAARSPALGGIVARMLRVAPSQRWDSMREVVDALENLTVHNSREDELRGAVMNSYAELQTNMDGFYAAFYARLFERLPDVKTHFRAERMLQQYGTLNRALTTLVKLDSSSARLKQLAQRHLSYGLTRDHFDGFQSALLDTLRDDVKVDTDTLAAWTEVLSHSIDEVWRLLQESAVRRNLAPKLAAG